MRPKPSGAVEGVAIDHQSNINQLVALLRAFPEPVAEATAAAFINLIRHELQQCIQMDALTEARPTMAAPASAHSSIRSRPDTDI